MAGPSRDPFRDQLDARWAEYLRTRERSVDHADWTADALSGYRDEIVHFGAQLLNDCAIRPWDPDAAARCSERYRVEAAAYDRDPDTWERDFWEHVTAGLPPALRAEAAGQIGRQVPGR